MRIKHIVLITKWDLSKLYFTQDAVTEIEQELGRALLHRRLVCL
jgi:hypothetical protein